MSTQDASEIPLSASCKQQAFKLLELPAELAELLESENPPPLQLKSAPSSTPSAPGYALLCTPNKTYRIQQKNSSNPLMILTPSNTSAIQDQDDAPEISLASVCNIATIEDTLELYVQESDNAAPQKKVNKWHEKFAKSRPLSKSKE